MKLRELHVAGFGKLVERELAFGEGLTIVVGENEAGKSTVATAIAATLFGVGRKDARDAWRPWSSARYAATLRYTLDDGRAFEVQRAFDDAKAVSVYDRNGVDIAGSLAIAKLPAPGEVHLGVPYDVFVNASCVRQREIDLESKCASAIAGALSRALGGGPKENAAVAAIATLQDALRDHVGTDRATKNAPLKIARERAAQARTRADAARRALHALADRRTAYETARAAHDALFARFANIERRIDVARAATVRARLQKLQELRDEIAEVQTAHARFADVADWPNDLAERFARSDADCERTRALAAAASDAALAARPSASEEAERAALETSIGAIDDTAYAALCEASCQAREAGARASEASAAAVAARHDGEGGSQIFGALVAATAIFAMATVGFVVARDMLVGVLCAIAAIAGGFALARLSARRSAKRKRASEAQARADAAIGAERDAASIVARVLEPRGIVNVDELGRRRDRFRELTERARRAAERTGVSSEATAAAVIADRALAAIVAEARLDAADERDAIRMHVRDRDARKRERDGLAARLEMLAFQRNSELGDDDEEALLQERERLAARIGDTPPESGVSHRALVDERAEIEAQLRAAEGRLAETQATLRASEEQIADVAALDDEVARYDAEVARLDAFRRAVTLAIKTVEDRTKEAHERFARRLEDYAARTFATITAGRYGEIKVDPTTLEVNVRVPETKAFIPLDRLSAGTRDQAYLVTRIAMARMFSEGLETPPLLLDDPVAFWDEARIARLLPLLAEAAATMQTVVFTASEAFATAAAGFGATVIRLEAQTPAIA